MTDDATRGERERLWRMMEVHHEEMDEKTIVPSTGNPTEVVRTTPMDAKETYSSQVIPTKAHIESRVDERVSKNYDKYND